MTISTIRLDKWLWAARFYKTRSLAKQAITGGKVYYNDQRVKPGCLVNIGATITLSQGVYRKTVIVQKLSNKRGSATIAATLYIETAESIQSRLALSAEHKQNHASSQLPNKRPNKHQRQQIRHFKRTD